MLKMLGLGNINTGQKIMMAPRKYVLIVYAIIIYCFLFYGFQLIGYFAFCAFYTIK